MSCLKYLQLTVLATLIAALISVPAISAAVDCDPSPLSPVQTLLTDLNSLSPSPPGGGRLGGGGPIISKSTLTTASTVALATGVITGVAIITVAAVAGAPIAAAIATVGTVLIVAGTIATAIDAINLVSNWNEFTDSGRGWVLAGITLDLSTAGFGKYLKSLKLGSNVGRWAKTRWINLADQKRSVHILFGDGSGGGHQWGLLRLLNGKSKFPRRWGSEKIMNAVSEVATSRTSRWSQKTGRKGAELTRKGRPVEWHIEGEYDGVLMRVVYKGGEIITAFPIK